MTKVFQKYGYGAKPYSGKQSDPALLLLFCLIFFTGSSHAVVIKLSGGGGMGMEGGGMGGNTLLRTPPVLFGLVVEMRGIQFLSPAKVTMPRLLRNHLRKISILVLII